MKLAIVTPFWGRADLAREMIRHTQYAVCSAQDDHSHEPEVVTIAVISPEDPERREIEAEARELWDVIAYAPNDTLGAKWNVGMQSARSQNADAVMILGSDDFVSREWIKRACAAIDAGMLLAGLTDFYALRLINGRMYHIDPYPPGHRRHGETIGSGRTFSRKLLDAVDWTLWPGQAARDLDAHGMRRLAMAVPDLPRRTMALTMEDAEAWLLDVRTIEGISSWPSYVGLSKPVEFEPGTELAEGCQGIMESCGPRMPMRPTSELVSCPMIALLKTIDDLKALKAAKISAGGIVDEWVCVVDDRSYERAGDDVKALAGFHKVERREFTGFADQRNYADSLCSYPWRFVIDADELLVQPGPLRDVIEKADANPEVEAVGMMVQGLCTDGSVEEWASIRAYRADVYEWKWPIHNELVRRDGEKTDVARVVGAPAVIEASYVGTAREKATRALGAIEVHRASDPDHPRWAFYAARASAMLGDAQRTAKYSETCIDLARKSGGDLWPWAGAWSLLARSLLEMRELERAQDVVDDGINLFPNFPDIRHIQIILDCQWFAQACHSREFAGMPVTSLPILQRMPEIIRLLGAEVTQ